MHNEELRLARTIIETTGTHLFLTGKAGTGKTTFLRRPRGSAPHGCPFLRRALCPRPPFAAAGRNVRADSACGGVERGEGRGDAGRFFAHAPHVCGDAHGQTAQARTIAVCARRGSASSRLRHVAPDACRRFQCPLRGIRRPHQRFLFVRF